MDDRTCWWNATVHHIQPDSDPSKVSLIFSVCFFANASVLDDLRRTVLHYFSQSQNVLIGTFVLFIYHGFQKLISRVQQLVLGTPNKILPEKEALDLGEKKKKKKKKGKKALKGEDSRAMSVLYLGQPVGRSPLKIKVLPSIPAKKKKNYSYLAIILRTPLHSTS